MFPSAFEKKYVIEPIYTDCFGKLKLSAALHFAQEAAGEHCTLLSLDGAALAQKQMFWAVIRHRVQITRMPRTGEKITVQTWPMPTTRVAYPRSTVAYDENGQELFRAISLWVLMDVETRAMILPGKSGIMVQGSLRGTELPPPRTLAPQGLKSSALRQVCYTDLDSNRHMNNTRYLDWVSDLLPSHFFEVHTPKDVVICYANEAREGQKMEITWGMNSDGILTVDAHAEGEKPQRIFSVQIEF